MFVARDGELNREVALKRIRGSFANDHSARARFLREAEITGNLEHPGIVPIYGLGRDASGQPYYAMRFIHGESLRDAIKRYHRSANRTVDAPAKQMELRMLMRRFIDVCNAVDYAHSRGVIHRDLKPANVMVGKFGETLVVDWGLAKALGETSNAPTAAATKSLPTSGGTEAAAVPWLTPSAQDAATQMGDALGTPSYMSPEQAAGRTDLLSPATDIYALGAVLHTILSGSSPIEGDSIVEVLENVKQGRMRRLPTTVASPVASICAKAMSLRPEDRYASARALADDVERWMADERVSVHRETRSERLARWARTHRSTVAGAAALAATALVALVIGLFVVTAEQRETDRQREFAEARRREAEQARIEESAQRTLAELQRKLAEDRKRDADDQRDRAEWSAYVAHIQAADAEWERNQVLHSLAHLNACLPKLCGWEHEYLRARSVRGRYLFQGSRPSVLALAVSPDGNWVFTSGSDGFIHRWDTAAGREAGAFRAHGGTTSNLAISRDGTRIVSLGADKSIKVWDAESARLLHTISVPGQPFDFALTPDGKHLITRPQHQRPPALINLESGEVVRWFEAAGLQSNSFALSPDGTQLAMIHLSTHVLLLEASTGKLRNRLSFDRNAIQSVQFSPDGKFLVCRHRDNAIRFRDVETGEVVRTFRVPESGLRDIVFSPDERYLATSGLDFSVRLWDVDSTELVRHFRGPALMVAGLAFSPDGRHIYGGGQGLTRWDAAVDANVRTFSMKGREPRELQYDDAGRLLMCCGNESIYVWDTVMGQKLNEFQFPSEYPTHATLRGDGACVVGSYSPDGRLRVWDLKSGEAKDFNDFRGRQVRLVKYSPSGKHLAGATLDGTLFLWDGDSGTQLWSASAHPTDKPGFVAITDLLFARDGLSVYTAGQDRTIKRWSIAEGKLQQTLEGHAFGVFAIQLSRDGARLLACASREVRVWDLVTGEVVHSFQSPNVYHAGTFDHDVKRLLLADEMGTIRIRDVASSTELLSLRAAGAGLNHLVLSPDGRTVATATRGSEPCVQLWETETTTAN